jgi:ABC-type nitrate/sulfonate/bicarbonate transport system substrate-binding protein
MGSRAPSRCPHALIVGVLVWLSLFAPALAADHVRVGKSLGTLWAFLPVDVGAAEHIFARYGIELEIVDMGNGNKLQQALASDSLDFGLAAGTDLVFPVKGAPVRAVAAFAAEPRTVVIIVHPNSPLNSVADLKGKLLAMPGAPSVAQWLVWQMALAQGWHEDDIRTVAQGSVQANVASFLTNQVDGIVDPVEVGFRLSDENKGRILVHLAKYAPHFHSHIVFARQKLIRDNPGLVDRFLKGFFASVAFMKSHKAETSKVAIDVLNESQSIADRSYDYEITMLSDDGRFDPTAIAVLKQSFVELGLIDRAPKDDEMLTEQFVPVKF